MYAQDFYQGFQIMEHINALQELVLRIAKLWMLFLQ